MERTSLNSRKSKFFLTIGIVGLLAIFIGFSKPFIIPVAKQTFEGPLSIYIHAFFSLGWVVLFTVQSYLIQLKNFKLHIKLGIIGALLAISAALTLIPVAKFIIERDLQNGLGETAYSNSVSLLTTGIMFLSLVGCGLYYRKKSQIHKRLILLSTIILLWPAWFRFRHFFPEIPRPDIWFGLVLADSLIIIAWIWDMHQNKKIHPSLLYPGIAIFIEQTLEVFMYDSNLWRNIGKIIYGIF